MNTQLEQLTERAEKAEAACAEKDEVLRELYVYITTKAKCPDRNIIKHALSSDCGRGHIPASELKPLVDCVRYAASVRTDRSSVEDGIPMCSQTADWCSGLIDAIDKAAPVVERLETLRKESK